MRETAKIYRVETTVWQGFLKDLSEKCRLYAPREGLVGLEYSPFSPEDLPGIVYGGARLTQPLKSFIYPVQERVDSSSPAPSRKTVIFGVKACDLKALRILDEIFLGDDIVDPFYQQRRNNTLLISDDCTEPLDTCFCTLLGDSPFPQNGFDLNLSYLDGVILVEVGSKRGEELLREYKVPLSPAGKDYLKTRQQKRREVVQRLRQINKAFQFPENITALIEGEYDSPVWKEVAEDCVSCGACTNICPSCHCFFLNELSSVSEQRESFRKDRTWDSCQYTGFARVAAGANPRSQLGQRFRNRFYCKFEYKPQNFDILACTGCGRCIQACQGKIDIREVLQRLGG